MENWDLSTHILPRRYQLFSGHRKTRDQRPEDFKAPELGRNIYRVSADISSVTSLEKEFDLSDPTQLADARAYYLSLAHSLGNAEEVSARAEGVLFRAGLLLQWSSFEIFLRETVEYL